MKWMLVLLALLLLPFPGSAEDAVLVRLDNLKEEYRFPADSPLMEVVFPRVLASDCAILRFGAETWLIDASTGDRRMHGRVLSALDSMGVTQIDTVFLSHPHPDHVGGLIPLADALPIGEVVAAFDADENEHSAAVADCCAAHGIPLRRGQDGEIMTLGPEGEVTLQVIQRSRSGWSVNDASAMLRVSFGARTILFAADVGRPAQSSYAQEPPACSLRADILKVPHHGQEKMQLSFLRAVDPAFALLTGASGTMDTARAQLRQQDVSYVVAYHGLTRLRTDGTRWVADYLHETAPDRETRNPSY